MVTKAISRLSTWWQKRFKSRRRKSAKLVIADIGESQSPAAEQSGPTTPPPGSLGDDDTPDLRARNLWNVAYERLQESNAELIQQYEELLSKEVVIGMCLMRTTAFPLHWDSSPMSVGIYLLKIREASVRNLWGGQANKINASSGASIFGYLGKDESREANLAIIIEQGLKRLQIHRAKFSIAGHEVILTKQIANVATFVSWTKVIVGEAVKASPEASIVWAGVCLVLPLLTSPKTAADAHNTGFKYVTTRMRYWAAFEPMLQELSQRADVTENLMTEASNGIIALYERVIEFQIRSVLRFFRSHIRTYARDLVAHDNWKKMREDFDALEKYVRNDLLQINTFAARHALELLDQNSRCSLERFDELLNTTDKQLVMLQEHNDLAKKGFDLQEASWNRELRDKEDECLQVFRLTDNEKDVTYEQYKARVANRIEGTCEWFLKHEYYEAWLKKESGTLLVSADPGCGKSVLAKFLVDQALPKSATICYFFFKQGDQSTARRALCAILHQMFTEHHHLIRHAMPAYEKSGKGVANSTADLWDIVCSVVGDPHTPPTIIVLDALDECDDADHEDLIQKLTQLMQKEKPGRTKWLLTSRPYENIILAFQDLVHFSPHIHIPGEEMSDAISCEVNQVIRYRVQRLHLSEKLRDHMLQRLLEMPQRTYLWVHLVLEYVKTNVKKTPKGFDSLLDNLPNTVNEAYDRILRKSQDDPMVRKSLHIILAACRPLTISELNIAVNMNHETDSPEDLDLEDDEDFQKRLRSWCGLFLTIDKERVYFLHQTCREFLLARHTAQESVLVAQSRWHHSIAIAEAHNILAGICIRCLGFLNKTATWQQASSIKNSSTDWRTLVDYASNFWSAHYSECDVENDDLALRYLALAICDPTSRSHAIWFQTFSNSLLPTPLLQASASGQVHMIELLLAHGANLEDEDPVHERRPLSWAVQGGHYASVSKLLQAGANIEAREKWGSTPLSLAVQNGDLEITAQLLGFFVIIYGYSPIWMYYQHLHDACRHGHLSIVELFLRMGLDWRVTTREGSTPLLLAASRGHDDLVRLFLRKGLSARDGDDTGFTPLMGAARHGSVSVVKLLLDHADADIEARESSGRTALSRAAEESQPAVVKALLERGADVNPRNQEGLTPLALAARRGFLSVVKLLLEHPDIDVDAKDNQGWTALSLAAEKGHLEVVQSLLDHGADMASTGRFPVPITPLCRAVSGNHETVVDLLLSRGARLDECCMDGQYTLLSHVAFVGAAPVVDLLLRKGSRVDITDASSGARTPLLLAAFAGNDEIVEMLLAAGASKDIVDEDGKTALDLARQQGHVEVVRILES